MIDRRDVLLNIKVWQRTMFTWICLMAALPSDWSMPAALAIFFMGRENGGFKRKMQGLIGALAVYAVVYALLFNVVYGVLHLAVVLSVPLLSIYNGKRGKGDGKLMKWLFYVYYPSHLLILGIIRIFFCL